MCTLIFFNFFFKKVIAIKDLFHTFALPKRGNFNKKFFQILNTNIVPM